MLGVPIEHACAAVGISRETHYRWLKEHDEYDIRVKEAESQLIKRDLGNIEAQAKDDWRASSWRLERRFPKLFGRSDRHEVTAEISSVDTIIKRIDELRRQGSDSDSE